MSLLLDDLLDMARITQGKLLLKRERVALASAVEAALEAARPALDAKQHRLEVRLPPEPLWLDADPVRLAQVLANLLSNAATYTPAQGHIVVSATIDDNHMVAVSVRDNGAGIAPQMLPTVFSMFVQALDGSVDASGGLGIGLAIVKGLVELHGGSVEAASAGPGQGSVFTVRLPLQVQRRQPVPPIDGDGTFDGQLCSVGRRVLVADDNADAAEMLRAYLSLRGHEVQVAADGEQALALAVSFAADVALLDIGMPKLNGYAVAERLRRDTAAPALRLAALTGWGQASDRESAARAGFDAHFTKPVDLDALVRWVEMP
jgi:CheY-like chemotaxis protein